MNNRIKLGVLRIHTMHHHTVEHASKYEKTAPRRFDFLVRDYGAGGASGNKQASATCRPLSRAKFITKSQAMTS